MSMLYKKRIIYIYNRLLATDVIGLPFNNNNNKIKIMIKIHVHKVECAYTLRVF